MPNADIPLSHPIGSIVMWSGILKEIPDGWFLCDGTEGTPNLTTRFIRGSRDTFDPGGTGGTDTHTLVEAELPSHTHTVSDPTHIHTAGDRSGAPGSTAGVPSGRSIVNSHNMQPNVSGLSINNSGSDSSHENRPAFFELAFIFRKALF